MKWYLCVLILVVTTGCPVYDPPQQGKNIFIENQTDDFIYVIDSLPQKGALKLYDTFLVNDKTQIEARPNYIPAYHKWQYFLSKQKYSYLKQKHIDSLCFYFIPATSITRTYDEINARHLYSAIKVAIDKIEENAINHIFYYKDSIKVAHHYDANFIAN